MCNSGPDISKSNPVTHGPFESFVFGVYNLPFEQCERWLPPSTDIFFIIQFQYKCIAVSNLSPTAHGK